MPENLPWEKRLLIAGSIGLFSFPVVALLMLLMGWASSLRDPLLLSSLPITFFSSVITGLLWRRDQMPDAVIWTISNVLFWGTAGLILGFVPIIISVNQNGPGQYLGALIFPLIGGIVGCIAGTIIGTSSYSTILEWEKRKSTNVMIGSTIGVISGFAMNLFACLMGNFFGVLIGGLCGLLTGLVISRFHQ